jgi:cbb3-type cytochrome oxidase subunit 3
MLQELAAQTGASALAIASMIFFMVAWVAIAVWVVRTRPEDLEARARLALEGDAENSQRVPPGTRTER